MNADGPSSPMLPPQATIIPLYVLFARLGWTGTWLPLLVPAFFANAYDVFLLRQYFMTIPRELDEAAAIDGANPLRVLISVIIPQATPAITAVTLFHFFYVWNDYFNPLVYLIGREDLCPGGPPPLGRGPSRARYVDAAADLGKVIPLAFGANHGPWAFLNAGNYGHFRESGVTLLRFPGGNWGDENNLDAFQIDMFLMVARLNNAEPLVSVRLRGGAPELAPGGDALHAPAGPERAPLEHR